jgi:hypothetical protein
LSFPLSVFDFDVFEKFLDALKENLLSLFPLPGGLEADFLKELF